LGQVWWMGVSGFGGGLFANEQEREGSAIRERVLY